MFSKQLELIMNSRKSLIATAIFGLAMAIALAACVVVPDQGHYAGGVVMVAPPVPRVEVVGVAPSPGYVWIGGYWNWVGGRHEWVAGRWAPGQTGISLGRSRLGAGRRRLAHAARPLGARLAPLFPAEG